MIMLPFVFALDHHRDLNLEIKLEFELISRNIIGSDVIKNISWFWIRFVSRKRSSNYLPGLQIICDWSTQLKDIFNLLEKHLPFLVGVNVLLTS